MPGEHHVSRKDYQRIAGMLLCLCLAKYSLFMMFFGLRSGLSILSVTPDAIKFQGNFACFMCRIRQANLTHQGNKSQKYIAVAAYESVKR